MRFLLYDRLTKVTPGERAEAVKCVSITEEFLREHYPRAPYMPPALILEAMVEVLGALVMVTHRFGVMPFLSLVEDATLPPRLGPGVRLDLVAELQSTNPTGSMGSARASVDGKVVASAGRILLAQFPTPDPKALEARFRALGALP